MAQEHVQKRRTSSDQQEPTEDDLKRAVEHPETDALKSHSDELLDEIDSLLEENAEEFLQGYIQKGGE